PRGRVTAHNTPISIFGHLQSQRAPSVFSHLCSYACCLSSVSCSESLCFCRQFHLLTTQFPRYNTSIRVFTKQSIASPGVHTLGSFSLNEVFSTTGTPLSSWKSEISW